MHKLILYRLLQFPLILAVIYVLTFLLAWVAPGSPFAGDRNVDKAVLERLERQFHAGSAWDFLAFYPRNVVLTGNFGPSLYHKEWSVNDILASALPVSITLGLFALLIGVVLGTAVGTLAAVKRGGLLDWTSLSVTLIGVSLPSFVTAAVLLLGFSYYLPLFPAGGWGSFRDLILPGLALSLAPMAYIVRLTRVSMLDVLGADYVRT